MANLRDHLQFELLLSETAVDRYWLRLSDFLDSLGNDADYALCRFEQWRKLGYRCVPFEKDWVFAYEVTQTGVIIRDMGNVAMLKK